METTRNSNLANELNINYLVAHRGVEPRLPGPKSGVITDIRVGSSIIISYLQQ